MASEPKPPVCPRPHVQRGIRETSNALHSYLTPCNRWSLCKDCGERRLTAFREQLVTYFLREERVFYMGPCEGGPVVQERITARFRRAVAAHPKREGSIVRITLRDATIHVFSTMDLRGKDEPKLGEWLTQDEAWNRLYSVMVWPELHRKPWAAGGWRLTAAPRKTIGLAYCPEYLFERVGEITEAALVRRYGTPANLGLSRPTILPGFDVEDYLPEAVSPMVVKSEWQSAVEQAREEAEPRFDVA